MAVNPPPIQENTTSINGKFPQVWLRWLDSIYESLSGKSPLCLQVLTVSTLPDATISEGFLVYVSDESGGAVPAFSDGVNWRRVTDRAVVS